MKTSLSIDTSLKIILVFPSGAEQPRELEVGMGAVEGEQVTLEKGLVYGKKIVLEGDQSLNTYQSYYCVNCNTIIKYLRR